MEPEKWKLVFIDDEKDIRDIMAIILRDMGYSVVVAENGEAGLNACDKLIPHIVITDVRMPKMNGIEVLKELKKKNSDIEVIVATGFGDMEISIKALQLDASDFIVKPIDNDALSLALKRAKERYTTRKKLKDYTRLLEQRIEDQAQILHQDKMMSLGRLSASVVHEINNPLSGILNYIRLMSKIIKKKTFLEKQDEKFILYLNLVETELTRCSKIVSNLLVFARKSKPAIEEISVKELIDRSVLLSKHKLELNKIDTKYHIEQDIPYVKGDFNQLQQVIVNLVLNAIDAMPDGGKLIINAESDNDKKNAVISIKDNGFGIAEEYLPDIFEPFFTTKKEGYGVGLGLATVYGIIKRHNGYINVKSKKGEGTTFVLYIPVERRDKCL